MNNQGSDTTIESREALTQDENKALWNKIRLLTSEDFKPWVLSNEVGILKASPGLRDKIQVKWAKYYDKEPLPDWKITVSDGTETGIPSDLVDLEEEPEKKGVEGSPSKAPAIISKLDSSIPPTPPESPDVIYMTEAEIRMGVQFNTRQTMLVHDPSLPDSHAGPFIERCQGRDQNTGKMIIVKLKAREVPILPEQMMRYRGSVVRDMMSVHTYFVNYKGRRWGYSFDIFYMHNGKRYERCCLIMDRIHQAGLMYEKVVGKKTMKAFSRIRQIKGYGGQATGEPMYEVIGQKEEYYRDLKRLYDRHFLKRGNEELADDIGLKNLIGAG